jgi:hypothetical protein
MRDEWNSDGNSSVNVSEAVNGIVAGTDERNKVHQTVARGVRSE